MEDAKFQAMLMRIATVTNSIKPKDLAPILGISPAAVSKALTKKHIPQTWLNTLATKYNLTHEWLIIGNASEQAENSELREERIVVEGVWAKGVKETLLFQVLGAKEQTIEAHEKTIESQEREIETLKGQIQDLKAENAELKERLSLFAATAAEGTSTSAA